MRTYKINEIFGPTIQGEGSLVGEAVLFLRFSKCNKWSGRVEDKEKSICHFCDTDFYSYEEMTIEKITEKLKSICGKVNKVILSGGEPLLQVDKELLEALSNNGFKICLETNGSMPLKDLTGFFFHISMSPKQSAEKTKLEKCDDIKILYPFIGEGIDLNGFKDFNYKNLFIQPIWDLKVKETLDFIYNNPEAKLSFQLHKFMGLK